jgi:DNA-binding transcriptional regulator YhcF (GntR family)
MLKKTKFQAIIKLQDAVKDMEEVGFKKDEILELVQLELHKDMIP